MQDSGQGQHEVLCRYLWVLACFEPHGVKQPVAGTTSSGQTVHYLINIRACRISRETLSGRSLESTMPLTKLR